ncbi:MAG TPA: hypothetical protein VL523_18000 [Terriglobia bacterium]|nr:hypothetical protein [Terriglobia bacterium]
MGAKRRVLSEDAVQKIKAAVAHTRDKAEYRRALCVWLPAALTLSNAEVAEAVGWPLGSVCRVQWEYRRRGEAALLAAGRAAPPAEDAAHRLRAAMKHAHSAPELRRAQCLFMRVVLGLSSSLVAAILGWDQSSVSHLHRKYLRQGDAALQGFGRGGARRQILSKTQEAEVLRNLARQAWPNGLLMFTVIHRAFEEAAGRPLKASSVRAILDRHGWVLAAVFVTPGQTRIPEGLPLAWRKAQGLLRMS